MTCDWQSVSCIIHSINTLNKHVVVVIDLRSDQDGIFLFIVIGDLETYLYSTYMMCLAQKAMRASTGF